MVRPTHRFQIKTTDVIQYLKDRDDYPELFKAPIDFYKKEGCKKAPSFDAVFTAKDLVLMRQFYKRMLASEPDVMTAEQVAQFTGYHKNSVARWCHRKELQCFSIRQRLYIPKEYLLEFLVSKFFIGITVKSEKHLRFNAQFRSFRVGADNRPSRKAVPIKTGNGFVRFNNAEILLPSLKSMCNNLSRNLTIACREKLFGIPAC